MELIFNHQHLYPIGILYRCGLPCNKTKIWTNSIRGGQRGYQDLVDYLEGKTDRFRQGICNDLFCGKCFGPIICLKTGYEYPGEKQNADLYGCPRKDALGVTCGNRFAAWSKWYDEENQQDEDDRKYYGFYRFYRKYLPELKNLIINPSKQRNPIYYHGTRQEHLPSIEKQGLVYPFLSSESEQAWCWGRNYSNVGGRDAEVFEVDLDDADLDRLIPDFNLMDPDQRAAAFGLDPNEEYFDIRSELHGNEDRLIAIARRLGINAVYDHECGGEASIYLGEIPPEKLRRVDRQGRPLRRRNPNPQKQIEALRRSLEKKFEVELRLATFDEFLIIVQIQVPERLQNQGIGTRVMQELIKYAAKRNLTIALTPEPIGIDPNTSEWKRKKKRLTNFYKRFGFKPNKGRRREFRVREAMLLRPPESEITSTS